MTSQAALTIQALYKCYMEDSKPPSLHPSIDGPMASALTFHLGDPGSIPGRGINETICKLALFLFIN